MSRTLRSVLTGLRMTRHVPTGQVVYTQRVRLLRNRMPTVRGVLLGTAACYVSLQAFDYLVLQPYSNLVKDLIGEISDEEYEELVKKSEPWFIPLPVKSVGEPSPPYPESSREYQDLAQLWDKVSQDEIRDQLQARLCRLTGSHPWYARRFGSQWRVSHSLLTFDRNAPPPMKIYQIGIELFGPNGTRVTKKPISYALSARRYRNLHPWAMSQSSWIFTKTMVKYDMNRLATYFGFAPLFGSQQAPSPRKLETPGTATKSAPSRVPGSIPKAGEDAERANAARVAASGNTAAAERTTPTNAAAGARSGPSAVVNSNSNADGIEGKPAWWPAGRKEAARTSGAWAAFNETLGRTWPRIREWPPPGCLKVFGKVILASDQATLHLYVTAWWNPKTQSFDENSMHVQSLNLFSRDGMRRGD